MRVAIDCEPITCNMGGIRVYTMNLVRAFARIEMDTQFRLYYSFSRRYLHTPLTIPRENFSNTYNPLPAAVMDWATAHTPLSHSFFLGSVDVVHSINFRYFKLTRGEKLVVTIHDVCFLLFPQFFGEEMASKLKRSVEQLLQDAEYVITISENTRRDFLEHFVWPEDRISAILPGVDIRMGVGLTLSRSGRRNIDAPYILSVGTLEPRKNYSRLFRAFSELKREHKEPLKLVVVGGRGWLYGETLKTWEDSSAREDIVILGRVDFERLQELYRGAEFFVYPSVYEGFGLPILEAQQMGLAVLAGDNSSIPEVCGDSALLVNTSSEREIAWGMKRLLADLDFRRMLVERGRVNLGRFSWDDTARRVLEVYQLVAGEG